MAAPRSRRFTLGGDYVESRAQVANGKGPGFAELHIKFARIGEGFDGRAPCAPRQSGRPCSAATRATSGRRSRDTRH